MLSVMADVRVGQWSSKSDITTGMSGGLPLTVFDKAMENTIVISPFTEFMATSSHLDTTTDPRVLQLGVFGKADKVEYLYTWPLPHTHTILYKTHNYLFYHYELSNTVVHLCVKGLPYTARNYSS